MKVDWFTVIAQLVNFGILLVILEFALFKRIVRAIDKRADEIAQTEAAASEARDAAEAEREAAAEARRADEAERDQLLRDAEDRAEDRADALEREARERVARLEARLRSQLGERQHELGEALVRTACDGVADACAEILTELAGSERTEFGAALVDELVDKLADRLSSLDDDARAELSRAWAGVDRLTVASSRPLTEPERGRLSAAVTGAELARADQLDYVTDPALTGGVELRGASHAVRWTIAGYLDQLRARLDAILDAEAQAPDSPQPDQPEQPDGADRPAPPAEQPADA